MACRSTLPRVNKRRTGWRCTGAGLVVVMAVKVNGRELPVVAPASRAHEVPLPRLDPPQPYLGSGDHLHVILPSRGVFS